MPINSCPVRLSTKLEEETKELKGKTEGFVKSESTAGQKPPALAATLKEESPPMCPTFGKTGSGKHYAKETVKLAIIDDSSDDDLRIPQSHRTSQIPFSKSCPPASSKVTGSTHIPGSCEKPTASPAPRGRKPAVPKDKSPVIPGDSRLFSNRVGNHWMDGHTALTNLARLGKPPPFYVRLRDDQVGHLLEWMGDKTRASITPVKVNQYWPHDIAAKIGIVATREKWGKAYDGKNSEWKLSGGPDLPSYLDIGLPPTFMSSGKAMHRGDEETTDSCGSKRKADQMLDEQVDRNGKRFCVWAKPVTSEDVMQAFQDRMDALKADHKTKKFKEEHATTLHSRDETIALKNVEIADLNGTVSKNRAATTDLEATIITKNISFDDLRNQKEDAEAKVNVINNVLAEKNTEIVKLRSTIVDNGNAITKLESSLAKNEANNDKSLAKIKRLNGEVTTLKTKFAEECNSRKAFEAKKKTELKDVRDKLKVTDNKAKTLEATILEKETTIKANNQLFSKRNQQIKTLETKLGFFTEAFGRCTELGCEEKKLERGAMDAEAKDAGTTEAGKKEAGAKKAGPKEVGKKDAGAKDATEMKDSESRKTTDARPESLVVVLKQPKSLEC